MELRVRHLGGGPGAAEALLHSQAALAPLSTCMLAYIIAVRELGWVLEEDRFAFFYLVFLPFFIN